MDRTILEPRQAYQQTLSGLARRVIGLERRAMWTGAVKQSSVTVESSGSVETSITGIHTWTQKTTLDLEPGRWILFGQVSHRITGVGNPAISDIWAVLGLRVVWTADSPDFQEDERIVDWTMSYSNSGSYSDSTTQMTALKVEAKTFSSVELQLGACASPASSINYYIYGVTLLALPG